MCSIKMQNYFALGFWSLQTRCAVYTFPVYIPVGTAHHRGSSGWSRPGSCGNPLGVYKVPGPERRGSSRHVARPHSLNLVLSKIWGCHHWMPAKPISFPLSSLHSHPSLPTHTHNVWNLQLKFPQRSLSLKNLQQKGQKSSHYGEQDEASLETENRVPIWPCNPTPGHISGANVNSKRYMHPGVHCRTVYNSHDKKQPVFTERWMDREDVVHIYNGILLGHKIGWNSAICSNRVGSRDDHTKWSRSERERHITYAYRLKCDTVHLTTKTHRHRQQTWLPKGEGGGINSDCEIKIHTTMYKRNNKALPCSTGNYIQYLAINSTRKESEKVYIVVV